MSTVPTYYLIGPDGLLVLLQATGPKSSKNSTSCLMESPSDEVTGVPNYVSMLNLLSAIPISWNSEGLVEGVTCSMPCTSLEATDSLN